MKHNYTDAELQAAIDEACIEIRREHRGKVGTSLVIDTAAMPSTYKAEASARLDLIKAALAALPEQCETQRISLEQLFQKPNAIADELQLSQLRPLSEAGEVPEGCVRYYTYKKDGEWTTKSKYRAMQDTHYIDTRLPESAEKPEPLVAEHKALTADEWAERWQAEVDARNRQYNELECTRAIAEKALTELAKTKENAAPQLRPLAEAGPVPEGCVRYHFSKYGDDIGVGTIAKHPSDVLFADIRLPAPAEKPDPYAELKKAHAAGKVIQCKLDVVDDFWEDMKDPRWGAKPHEYRIKPEPEPLATKPISPPTWTPKVGDVVTLKSGGPKMTIRAFDRDDPMEAWCHWFKEEKSCAETFPTACLQPA